MKSTSTSGSYKVKELNSTQVVEDALILIIEPENGEGGAICPDHFTTMDAITACKQMNSGIGGRIVEVRFIIADAITNVYMEGQIA